MVRRAEVNCRICHSFSHSTKQCKKIVLGFEKDKLLKEIKTDKVLGLSEAKVQELVNKYGCIINRKELVPVVSVEQLKKICQELYTKATDVHPTAQDLLSAVRKEASNE